MYTEPDTFKQDWNHQNIDEIKYWRDSIMDELDTMEIKKVWELV